MEKRWVEDKDDGGELTVENCVSTNLVKVLP